MGHRSGRECPGTPTERLRPGRPDRDRSPARWTACGLAPDPDARLFNVGSSAAGDRRLSPSGPHNGSAAMMASAHCGICRAGVLGEMHPPPVGLDHPLRPLGAQPRRGCWPRQDHVAAAGVGQMPRPVAVDLHRGRVRFGRIKSSDAATRSRAEPHLRRLRPRSAVPGRAPGIPATPAKLPAVPRIPATARPGAEPPRPRHSGRRRQEVAHRLPADTSG